MIQSFSITSYIASSKNRTRIHCFTAHAVTESNPIRWNPRPKNKMPHPISTKKWPPSTQNNHPLEWHFFKSNSKKSLKQKHIHGPYTSTPYFSLWIWSWSFIPCWNAPAPRWSHLLHLGGVFWDVYIGFCLTIRMLQQHKTGETGKTCVFFREKNMFFPRGEDWWTCIRWLKSKKCWKDRVCGTTVSPKKIRNTNSIRDAEMFLPKNHGINDSKRLEKTCAYLYPFVFVIYCLITYHDGSMGQKWYINRSVNGWISMV